MSRTILILLTHSAIYMREVRHESHVMGKEPKIVGLLQIDWWVCYFRAQM